ncbi:hypothetical protein V9Z76_19350 [Klebsiella pneumoniae]|uniref:hypothetical protein n=2 Tax=Klebsiella pneumoniae TaxID=573 RepID=UPI00312F4982
MVFWDDSYKEEFDSISHYIDENFIRFIKAPDIVYNVNDAELVDTVLVIAWRNFKRLYTRRLDALNKYTPYNQQNMDQGLPPSLKELQTDKITFLYKTLRILYEFYFWSGNTYGLPTVLQSEILNRLDKLNKDSNAPVHFIWIEQSMPAGLTKHLLLSEEFSKLQNIAADVGGFEEKISEQVSQGLKEVQLKSNDLNSKINGLISSANESVKSLQEYDEKLQQYKSEYNFVLLSKAFSNLLKTKKSEYATNHKSVIIFSSFLIATPLLALLNHIYNFYPVEFNLNAIFYFLPILSLELLFFYFMRLYYIEGKAIRAQMLQIEQRLSLCEFIHDYVETKNNSSAEKESWSLFEKLIFSPIQVSSENIPSLLDGASSIAELAGKVLSKDSK